MVIGAERKNFGNLNIMNEFKCQTKVLLLSSFFHPSPSHPGFGHYGSVHDGYIFLSWFWLQGLILTSCLLCMPTGSSKYVIIPLYFSKSGNDRHLTTCIIKYAGSSIIRYTLCIYRVMKAIVPPNNVTRG